MEENRDVNWELKNNSLIILTPFVFTVSSIFKWIVVFFLKMTSWIYLEVMFAAA